MEAFRTPAELVQGLQQRESEARARLRREVREPLAQLLDRLIQSYQLPYRRDELLTSALHTCETLLRTRPASEFARLSWPAFRATLLLQIAKFLTLPFGREVDSPLAGPEPLPESPSYDSRTFSRPFERIGDTWFGGDWFAGVHGPDGSLWVLLADITGHGYHAYLLASGLPGVWAECWRRLPAESEPIDLLAAMHDLLATCLPEGIFVECTLARLRPTGEVTVVPGGGTRLLHRSRGEPHSRLIKLRGGWLGLLAPQAKDQHNLVISSGDELLLGTDGLFDHLTEHHEALQLESPEVQSLFDRVQELLGHVLEQGPQLDDITMVLLRRKPGAQLVTGDVPV